MSWWDTPEWRGYERACGVEGDRRKVLDAADWQTRVVDLRRPYPELWRDVRRSYHSLIHKAEHQWTIEVCGSGEMAHFKALHAAEAGRQTRPDASWDLMAGWVGGGRLLLVGARGHSGAWMAFAAFEMHRRWAYYGHAAAAKRDVNHALVWHAMVALKARGIARLEMGWQGQDATDKGQALEFFRRGFGGTDVPAASGEDAWT